MARIPLLELIVQIVYLSLCLCLDSNYSLSLAITVAGVTVVILVGLELLLQPSQVVAAGLDGGELLLLPETVDVLVHHPVVFPQSGSEHVRLGQAETVEADPDVGDVVVRHEGLASAQGVLDSVDLPGC